MKKIMIASTNTHKIKEFKLMLEPLGYEVHDLTELPEAIDVEETGITFEQNAVIKAENIRNYCQMMAIADDSGLEIDVFNGEPGVNSARYLGHDTDYAYKNKVILERLEGVTNRKARFVSAIALAIVDEPTKVFTGYFEGEIGIESRGENGFGYDPIFYLPELGCSSSELPEEEKNKISHRGKALQLVLSYLKEREYEKSLN